MTTTVARAVRLFSPDCSCGGGTDNGTAAAPRAPAGDDGNSCTSGETCQANGTCGGGTDNGTCCGTPGTSCDDAIPARAVRLARLTEPAVAAPTTVPAAIRPASRCDL